MPETDTLLLEIGCEELPSSFVDAALAALPTLVRERLAALRLPHGELRALGTPRRLAVLVPELALAQADLDEEVVGPPEAAAFKDGAPTKAAEAFATKLGVEVASLVVKDFTASGKQKAGRFVTGRRVEKGRLAKDLLGPVLAEICEKIPFRKSMRWGTSGDAAFGRPVQWLVALLGADTITFSFANVVSDRVSRGHRFLSEGTFSLAHASDYEAALSERHVLVDRKAREALMMERVAKAAELAGGKHDADPSLVPENASLVEEPFVVTGSFDERFLALPADVIRAVARGHQKYFCVETGPDTLVPRYVAVVNTALAPDVIAKGIGRVMRARLADAEFFFGEDKKAKLEDRIEKLSGIVFHNRLGTVREKVARVERLAGILADHLGFSPEERARVARAAHLCKFDLVSLMVGEFPELQGSMGRTYALAAGEEAAVADAIRDHYMPLGGTSPVPTDGVAVVVALADRLDSLTGCFAVGLSPTGAADPFALRRACIAILRTIVENAEALPALGALDLGAVLQDAYLGLEGKKLDLSCDETTKKVLDFAMERLRGLIAGETSTPVADAVLGDDAVLFPARAFVRARVLSRAVVGGEPWLEKARTVAKRLSGIAKDATPVLHGKDVFTKEDDATIVDVVGRIASATGDLTTEARVREGMSHAEDVAERLDAIFVRTLVNDPADALTPKRLEVLAYGAQAMRKIADFSRLS
jgi:glycyl-tRNA synthetase beta chain